MLLSKESIQISVGVYVYIMIEHMTCAQFHKHALIMQRHLFLKKKTCQLFFMRLMEKKDDKIVKSRLSFENKTVIKVLESMFNYLVTQSFPIFVKIKSLFNYFLT